MALSFNGTTITFNGTGITGLRSIRAEGRCAPVPQTAAETTPRTYKPGIPAIVVTVVVLGSSALVKGATGALAVTWPDGGTFGTMTKARLMRKPAMSGGKDREQTTTLVFRSSK